MIRAIRLELVKPLDEAWTVVGPELRALAKATPELLNAAMDACVSCRVVGAGLVKSKIAPEATAETRDGLAYQAVLREAERLREWGAKKNHRWASLDASGAVYGAISRAASQAFAQQEKHRKQPGATSPAKRKGRVNFASERIVVRADGVALAADGQGVAISLKLKSGRTPATRFAVAHSRGSHRDTVKAIVSGEIPHGDAKLQWDDRRKKWYALVSYEPPEPTPVSIDPARVLIVHRGVRNAVWLLATTGQSKAVPGGKFVAQRRGLQARQRDMRKVSAAERGGGAKGRGRSRRFESHDALEGKIARVTHTFCQQVAARVAELAKAWGCGTVLIEDYGGIEPSEDCDCRRVLDRFPLYEMKQCIASRLEREGMHLRETPAAFISTTCPRCEHCEPANHVRRTGMFRCRVCMFERPADWVAAFWMGVHGGADMSVYMDRLRKEWELAKKTIELREAAE